VAQAARLPKRLNRQPLSLSAALPYIQRMAVTVGDIAELLAEIAPLALAEEWDNVGLLIGDRSASAARVMTCLTVTPQSASEAIAEDADLIVTHHPVPFRPLKRITTESTTGRLLLDLISAGVAVYSAHTAFDSARSGINQQLAEGLDLRAIRTLVESSEAAVGDAVIGAGRIGEVAESASLTDIVARLKSLLVVDAVQVVGDDNSAVRKVSIACGSGGEFLDPAIQYGCDLLVTGEAKFHTCLEAEAAGIALALPGHFASERFAMRWLAEELGRRLADTHIWCSRREADPLRWIS